MPAQDDDAILVSASQQGDLNAFEKLVARHQKRMLNVGFRLIGDYDDACEVVQDAFVSAYKSIKSFRGEAKFTTWLTTITVNLSKNRLKQMRARRGHEAFSLDEQVQTEDGHMTIDPPSKEPSVLDRMNLGMSRRGSRIASRRLSRISGRCWCFVTCRNFPMKKSAACSRSGRAR